MKGDKTHKIECPKYLNIRAPPSSLQQCNKLSPEVRVVRGESIHECPDHGLFKIGHDGSISFWLKPTKGRWKEQRYP